MWRRSRSAPVWLGACLLLVPPTVAASADGSLQVSLSPVQSIYPPGASGTAWFEVSNLGPDVAAGGVVSLQPFAFGGLNSQVTIAGGAETAPCTLSAIDLDASPGFHGLWYLQLAYPDIPAGASVACGLAFEVEEFARGSYSVDGTLTFSQSDDPAPTNNRAAAAMRFTPVGAPEPVADLSLDLDLQPDGAMDLRGSDLVLSVAVRNLGPAATPPSMVRFTHTRASEAAAGVLITGAPSTGAGDNCLAGLEAPPAAPGQQVLRVAVPGQRAGEHVVCLLRLQIAADATLPFVLSALVASEPDFGEPTLDLNTANNAASLTLGGTSHRSAVQIPASHPWALWSLLVLVLLGAHVSVAGRRDLEGV